MFGSVAASARLWQAFFALGCCLCTADVSAEVLLACALKGSTSVMIGGRPALRLSDVANCPASLYEIVPSVRIEGQPMVHVKPVVDGKTTCSAGGDASVSVEGKPAVRLGDVACGRN